MTVIVWCLVYLMCAVLLAGLWYPCCTVVPSEPECNICSADSETVTVTISGLTSHTWCDRCENLNGTYVLTRTVNECAWSYSVSNNLMCNGTFPPSTLTIVASVGVATLTNWWFVKITFMTTLQGADRTSEADYEWDSESDELIDCTAEQSLSYEGHTPSATHPMCDDWDGLTVTVNAA